MHGSLGARSATMRFTSQTSRMAVVAPRPVITRVHSTTNGSAPPDSPASLRTVDIDGVTFVAASQAIDYLLQKEPDTLMQSGAVRMLQQKLDQVQDELTAKLAENAELRKSSMESDKKSRKQTTETQDMKEELQTLRLKITKATEDLKQAQATANNAMEEARVAVTSELSQKYLDTRDKQLAKMHESVKASMAKLEAAEAAAAKRTRAAEGSIVDTAMKAADKVNSEAAEAVAMSRARVEVAESAAKSAQEAAKHAQESQMETIKVAERLFTEASASSDLAASAQSEAAALQEEVKQLRGEVTKALQQRDDGLRAAAERQARAVKTVRTAHEMCEHRVQQAQNDFEALKLAERDGARIARDDTERIGRRCADLEERERELLRNQGSLQEALVQVGARAQAAEEKLEKRIEELQAEHKEVIAVMTTNAAASLELAKAESMESAQKQAQSMIKEAKAERKKMTDAMELEKSNLEKLLGSVNEELQYWQDRSKRTEAACTTLQADVMSLARMLPDDMSSMKLAVEGKITRTLIERSAQGMEELVALDDEWLPPLDTEKPSATTKGAATPSAAPAAAPAARRKSKQG